MLLRTAKSCGSDTPMLVSSSRRLVGPTGRGQNLNPLDDGGKRARSPRRARSKPSNHCVRERRVIPGYSLLLVCFLPIQSAHEAAGAKGARRSPRPLIGEGGKLIAKLARNARRDREAAFANNGCCLKIELSVPHSSFRDAPLGAGPESILPVVVMDSGLARSLSSGRALRGPVGAPRNDGLRWRCGVRNLIQIAR
jgi:hypothetical protein